MLYLVKNSYLCIYSFITLILSLPWLNDSACRHCHTLSLHIFPIFFQRLLVSQVSWQEESSSPSAEEWSGSAAKYRKSCFSVRINFIFMSCKIAAPWKAAIYIYIFVMLFSKRNKGEKMGTFFLQYFPLQWILESAKIRDLCRINCTNLLKIHPFICWCFIFTPCSAWEYEIIMKWLLFKCV